MMRFDVEFFGGVLLGALFMLFVMSLAGCATPHPSRQMNEMSTDDLIRELARPIP